MPRYAGGASAIKLAEEYSPRDQAAHFANISMNTYMPTVCMRCTSNVRSSKTVESKMHVAVIFFFYSE
jgi:hypothetical protein